jgi:hypothetical protein
MAPDRGPSPWLAPILSFIAIAITVVWAYLQMRHWADPQRDYVTMVGNIAVPLVISCGAALIGWLNLRQIIERTKAASDKKISNSAIRSELDRLNAYQIFALQELAKTGGMTGAQFADRLQDWGFPIASLLHQKNIAAVFELINGETTLLTQTSGVWRLRNQEGVANELSIL